MEIFILEVQETFPGSRYFESKCDECFMFICDL